MSNAHITIDGRPLCEFGAIAYWERLHAAGNPPCCDKEYDQACRSLRVAEQFPGRVALVFAECPTSQAVESEARDRRLQALRDEVKAAKIADAQHRCNTWLADGNAAQERGNTARAEQCYAKSQFWLDRLNKLEGMS